MATATGKPPEDEVVVVEDDAEADATTVSVTMLAGAGSRRTGVGAIMMGSEWVGFKLKGSARPGRESASHVLSVWTWTRMGDGRVLCECIGDCMHPEPRYVQQGVAMVMV
jgi:hypothetical protein